MKIQRFSGIIANRALTHHNITCKPAEAMNASNWCSAWTWTATERSSRDEPINSQQQCSQLNQLTGTAKQTQPVLSQPMQHHWQRMKAAQQQIPSWEVVSRNPMNVIIYCLIKSGPVTLVCQVSSKRCGPERDDQSNSDRCKVRMSTLYTWMNVIGCY